MDLETQNVSIEVSKIKSKKKPLASPFLNNFTSILNILPPFGFSLLLYTIGLLVSWLAAGGNGLRFWGLAGAVGVFWLVWLVFGRTRRYREFYYFTLALVVILAILGLLTLPMLDDDYLRTNSISDKILGLIKGLGLKLEWLTMHRNTLAGMLAVFGPLALAFTFYGRRWWERLIGLGSGLIMLGTLLATNSRGPLLAFGIGVIILTLLKTGVANKAKTGWKSLLVFRPIVFLVVFLVLTSGYLAVSGQWKLFSPDKLVNENGLGRLDIWQNSITIIEDVPFTGLGIGNFKEVYPFYLDSSDVSGQDSREHAHNLFLQSYVELGLAGFIAVTTATMGWFFILWRTFRKNRNNDTANLITTPFQDSLLKGGLAAYGGMLVYGMTEHSTWYGQWVMLLWLPLALVASTVGMRSQESGVRNQHLLRRYLPNAIRRKVAITFVIPVLLVLGWQGWGLAQVNQASLEKLQSWRENNLNIAKKSVSHYLTAEGIVGWTGVPARGLALTDLLLNEKVEAEKYLQEALIHSPNDKQLLLLMGDLKEKKGEHSAAIEFWLKANAAEIFYWRGRKWMDTDKEDVKAEPYFLRAIEVDQRHWGSYEFLVMLYQRHSRTPDSIALLEKAVGIFPENPRPAQMLNELKRTS